MFTAEAYRENEKQKRQTEYSPIESDSLFWCLFIIKYGKKEYDMIPEHMRKNREIDEKKNVIAHLSKDRGGEKKKVQEIISILSAEVSSLPLIPSICQYYGIPVAIPVIRGKGAHIFKYSIAGKDVIYATTR
jgi:hypothetical protein